MHPAFLLRPPTARDGAAVHQLIQNSPPLDTNSLYWNLLQCSHFANTCVAAVHTTANQAPASNAPLLGFMSGYIPPSTPNTLFIWQVAVNTQARGQGLARAMLTHLLARPHSPLLQFIETTITQNNAASWALFQHIAKQLNAPFKQTAHFEKNTHFNGVHDTEYLVRIGPFT